MSVLFFFLIKMKKATTLDEQLELLQNRGMIISNKNKAKEILLDIGYYRLGFYWFPFEQTFPKHGKKRSHQFKVGTTFEDAVDLYYFDHDLRKIIQAYLERIEINLRTFVIYHISNTYSADPIWFMNVSLIDASFITHFKKSYKTTILPNNDAIKLHHKKYPKDVYAPAWKTLEYATFGDIILLCKNIKDQTLQHDIANHYGIRNLDCFFSCIDTTRLLRNFCAHGHNIFDLKLQKSIKARAIGNLSGTDYHTLVGALKVLIFFLNTVSRNRVNDLKTEISELLNKNRTKKIYSHISYLEAVI